MFFAVVSANPGRSVNRRLGLNKTQENRSAYPLKGRGFQSPTDWRIIANMARELLIVGAGPKAVAVAIRADALRKAGLHAPE